MSHFDHDFRHFANASGYRNKRTDHETKFTAFRNWAIDGTVTQGLDSPFVIQFVCHPNFGANLKTVSYFKVSSYYVEEQEDLPVGYRRANAYKNYKSTAGHPKRLFYELNLYTTDGVSNHHTTRVSGSRYERDGSHDKLHGSTTKGRHWLDK